MSESEQELEVLEGGAPSNEELAEQGLAPEAPSEPKVGSDEEFKELDNAPESEEEAVSESEQEVA